MVILLDAPLWHKPLTRLQKAGGGCRGAQSLWRAPAPDASSGASLPQPLLRCLQRFPGKHADGVGPDSSSEPTHHPPCQQQPGEAATSFSFSAVGGIRNLLVGCTCWQQWGHWGWPALPHTQQVWVPDCLLLNISCRQKPSGLCCVSLGWDQSAAFMAPCSLSGALVCLSVS